ncbi:MAG: hypothetical protein CXR31_04530 [Geobacter sp.]|nr:MAG: hypothetical protein CXR31_04530 [Geobacter sp.]
MVNKTKISKAQEKKKPEKKYAFNLQVPESLSLRYKAYMDKFEQVHGVRPVMTKLILQAMEERIVKLEEQVK